MVTIKNLKWLSALMITLLLSNTTVSAGELKKDTKPPLQPVISSAVKTQFMTSIAWYSTSDNSGGSGIKGYYFLMDNNKNTVVNRSNGIFIEETTYNIKGNFKDYEYMHVVSCDKENNVSSTASAKIGEDTESPNVTVTINQVTDGDILGVDLFVTGGDSSSGLAYILDPSGVVHTQVPFKYKVRENGNYLFTGVDWAGNAKAEFVNLNTICKVNPQATTGPAVTIDN